LCYFDRRTYGGTLGAISAKWPPGEFRVMAPMSEDPTSERLVQLGPFVVDTADGDVKRNGQRIRLTEQPRRVLLALLERPGEIISREDLRLRLWPSDTNVEFDHSIHAAINKLRQALGDSPEQPKFIETIPRRGYRLIARPLAAGTHAVCGPIPPAAQTPVPWWKVHRFLLASGTGLLVIAVLVASGLRFRSKNSRPAAVTPSTASSKIPRRIAILGFRNLSGRKESDWLSTAFSEMLASELGTNTDLQPVSGEDVVQMKRDLAIRDADSYSHPTLQKIEENLGTDLVLIGSFMPIGQGKPSDRIRFDVRLLKASTGQALASLSETGTMADLFDLISDAGLRLRLQLGVTALSSSEQAGIRRSMPTDSAAQSLYFSGLERIRIFDYKGAREVLGRAVASDPGNALAHEELSIADGASGYESLAAKEAELAFKLTKGLSYEQGLQIEGRYYETKHDWGWAEKTYHRLCELSPRSIEYAVRLAHVQALDGNPTQAMATLRRLRVAPSAARDEARITLAQAAVYQQAGDSRNELTSAKAAEARAQQAHAAALIAVSIRMQGLALNYLGQNTQALTDARQAEKIFETLQEPGGVIDTLIDQGDILSDLGDMSAAENAWRKALTIAQSTGNKQKEAAVSNNLGNVFLARGEPAQARGMYARAYALSLAIDDKMGEAAALLTTGDALQDEGRLLEAKQSHERSLELSSKIANREGKAEALEALAGDLANLGDSAQARRVAQEAISAARESGDKPTEAASLVYLSQAIAAQGDLAAAESTVQKAASSADALGDKTIQAGSHRVLAQILALQGDAIHARTHYEQALALAESAAATGEERETLYALANLAIDQRRLADAREILRRLQAELKNRQNLDAELECLILQTELDVLDKHDALSTALRARSVSRLDDRLDLKMSAAEALVRAAAAGRTWTQADQAVSTALLQVSRSGCVACQLNLELAQCELKAEENAADASACFISLQKTAERKGFGQIAKTAAGKSRLSHL